VVGVDLFYVGVGLFFVSQVGLVCGCVFVAGCAFIML